MADITMCKGTRCKLKNTCYRYKAKRSYLQSYFVEVPYKDGNCDMYWELLNKLRRNNGRD